MLLVATAFVGAGFGLTVPALNTLAAAFHPAALESSILVLNALLGLGTALAPVFVAIFVGLGFWVGPARDVGDPPHGTRSRQPRFASAHGGGFLGCNGPSRNSARFWVYACFAVLYGVCETVNGNWSQLDMTRELGASTSAAAVALTAFWAMVTAGRVLFAAVDRWLPVTTTYRALPFALAATFVVIALLPDGAVAAGIVAFALAGLGCSALLPLTIGFGERELPQIAAAMAGGVIAAYQVGYGLAAFGVGPLLDHGVTLAAIYGASAVIAVAMGVASFRVVRPRPAEA